MFLEFIFYVTVAVVFFLAVGCAVEWHEENEQRKRHKSEKT